MTRKVEHEQEKRKTIYIYYNTNWTQKCCKKYSKATKNQQKNKHKLATYKQVKTQTMQYKRINLNVNEKNH